MSLDDRLADYKKANRISTKGPLCVVLVFTRIAIKNGLPMDPEKHLTKEGGQVKGLGKAAVQSILAKYGENRVLAEEGGRTSRGSMNQMRKYVSFLNDLHSEGLADLEFIESWWVDRIKDFFAGKPFKLKYDSSKSLRAIIRDLLEQALKRQKQHPGTMFCGAVMQHLVGAKLELLLPEAGLKHNGFSVADAPTERPGDFHIDDVAIHVTTAPTEALIRKCSDNLESGLRPIIVTTYDNAAGADMLAANMGIEGRIDILDTEQFLAANLYELSSFRQSERKITIKNLVSKYNEIVKHCETDRSLLIDVK